MLKTLLLAGLFTVSAAHAGEPTLRLEASVGLSKHKLAPEGAWWYEGFDTDTKLTTGSYSLGLLWLPIQRGDWRIGGRLGYADLGRVTASNKFPVYEDRSNRDARINSDCNTTTLDGCTGKFYGEGTTKGLYFGPALERSFGNFTFGSELGAYVYRSSWVAKEITAIDNNGVEFKPDAWNGVVWNLATQYHATWYVGANARWDMLFIEARRFASVHASRAEVDPMYIGMTSGPVWSVMLGLSVGVL